MTKVQAVDAQRALNNQCAVYNGVKIKINNPQANTLNDFKNNGCEYNAVSIEVNNPEVNASRNLYEYPKAKDIVTFDKTGVKSLKNVPVIPVAYQTNLINNRTFINAELEIENKYEKKSKKGVSVPPPNITTTEAEKKTAAVSFNGLSFRGAEPVIKTSLGIQSSVNIDEVLANLASSDYDVQALQLEKIAKVSLDESQKAIPYITTAIFSAITDIVNKDTSDLVKPTEEQTEIRKKIIANMLVSEQAASQGKNIDKSELPFSLTDEEINMAKKLSPFEMAERNKEYGVYTLAALAKVYADETEKKTGSVVPLTDMPGVSTFVDVLKTSKNPGVKVAAINAFLHLRRPEYNDEIKSVLQIVANDNNRYVAQNAEEALKILG